QVRQGGRGHRPEELCRGFQKHAGARGRGGRLLEEGDRERKRHIREAVCGEVAREGPRGPGRLPEAELRRLRRAGDEDERPVRRDGEGCLPALRAVGCQGQVGPEPTPIRATLAVAVTRSPSRNEGWVRRVKRREVPMKRRSLARAYSYAWITAGLFVFSIVGHWVFGWFAFVGEQVEHGQAADVGAYLLEMGRDTFENWQSEFLQLLWQVG